jgi:hypothetical protein
MQKPNLLKHTPHMSQWAQDLKDEREYDSDETIHYLVALRQLDDQVQDSLFTGDAANMPLSDARTLMHMRFLESQLAEWKRGSQTAGAQRCRISVRLPIVIQLLTYCSTRSLVFVHGHVAAQRRTPTGVCSIAAKNQ